MDMMKVEIFDLSFARPRSISKMTFKLTKALGITVSISLLGRAEVVE